MDYLGTLIVCGFATAFVMSVLEYFVQNPLIRVVLSLLTSFGSNVLLIGIQIQIIPLSLGSTFLGVFLISIAFGGIGGSDAKVTTSRVPRL
jgi:hypothetical protein